MRVGLFIPCYVDLLYPRVGLATVELLERHGFEVDYPEAQTCCGQPMGNAGFRDEAARLAKRFLDVFDGYDHVVAPSGSCVAMVRRHYEDLLESTPALERVRERTWELCEFLTDVAGAEIAGSFPHRVAVQPSCHGLRELRLGPGSERRDPARDKVRSLLAPLRGIELVEPLRRDECCGFGGTFAVDEGAVATMMGRDRLDDFARAGAEIVTATDVSCLAHLGGLVGREGRPLRVMHVAEILAVATAEAAPR